MHVRFSGNGSAAGRSNRTDGPSSRGSVPGREQTGVPAAALWGDVILTNTGLNARWIAALLPDAELLHSPLMPAKRPAQRPPKAGTPIRNPAALPLEEMAARAVYVGSDKHKQGLSEGRVGRPGRNPTTVEQAREKRPTPPFTMMCPMKWNNRSDAATALLRQAIRRGQIGHHVNDGLPEYVWARDPDDATIVYQARRLSYPAQGYKAYPLIEPEINALRIEIR